MSAPAAGEPSISGIAPRRGGSALLNMMRLYQVYYRDANPSFCPAPNGNTWNVSSGLRIRWLP